MKTWLRSIALLAMVLFALALFAQSTGTGAISGTVTDPSGAVVPNAQVTVINVNTRLTRTTTTSTNGSYAISNLPPGMYDVRVSAAGFGAYTARAIVNVGGTQTVDSHLKLEAYSTTVEVIGAGGAEVNTENQMVSSVVTSSEVTQLPTLTRNPYDLVATAGNVSQGDPQNQGNRGAGFNINGQRSASTDILLDGGENVDLFTSQVGQSVPLDSVQEFRVVTSDFTAQYGRASGGVVNVATKSGTNAFHGSAYEFNRISALAANTFENDARLKDAVASGTCSGIDDPTCPGRKGVFTRNQFGLAIGGPIKKDKLFFFANEETIKVRSQGVQNLLVPMPQFIAAAAPSTQAFFNAFGKLSHPVNGTVFTAGDLVAAGKAGPLLSALPASTPVFGVANFAVPSDAGGGNPQDTYLVVGRVDYNMTDKTTMFGRYSLEKETNPNGVINFSPYSGFDTGQRIQNNNAMFSINHIFGTNLVSQTRLVYNRLNLQQPLGSAPVGPTLYMNPVTQQNLFGVAVAFPGYNELTPGNAIPFGGPQNLGQIYHDVSWTKGAHNFKFGGQFIYTQDNRAFGAYEEAVEALANTGKVPAALDNFLSGQLFQFQAAVFPQGKFPCPTTAAGAQIKSPACTVTLPVGQPDFTRSNRYKDTALYFQDSWKVFPTLTVNAGIRWEYYGVQHNKDPNKDSNFYLGSGSNVFQQYANGSVQIAPNSPEGGLWRPRYHNFAPRVGFAWDVFGNGKTSLRGGYGIAYERNFGNVTFNVIQNPPNYAVLSLLATDVGGNLPVTTDNAGPLSGNVGSKALPKTSLRNVAQDIPTAYAHMWSMSVEREIRPNTVLTLSYTGSRGVHQYVIQNPNLPGSGAVYLGQGCSTPACDGPNDNPLARMNLQYTNINRRDANGTNSYNGLNVGLRSTISKLGLQLNTNYTWSHSIDDLSTTFSESNNQFNLGLTNPFDPSIDKGSSDYDIRHRLAVSAIWDVPLARHSNSKLWSYLLGGYQLAPIFEIHTGTPFTIYDSVNALQNVPRWDPGSGVAIPTSVVSNPVSTGVNLFNIMPLPASGGTIVGTANPADVNPLFGNVFGLDTANGLNGTFGISDFGVTCTTPGSGALAPCRYSPTMTGRNAFRGPGWWNFTMAAYKDLKLTERFHAQLRAEGYNLFNHHNMYVLGTTADVGQLTDGVQAKKGGLGSASFLGAAADERRNVQLAIKLIW